MYLPESTSNSKTFNLPSLYIFALKKKKWSSIKSGEVENYSETNPYFWPKAIRNGCWNPGHNFKASCAFQMYVRNTSLNACLRKKAQLSETRFVRNWSGTSFLAHKINISQATGFTNPFNSSFSIMSAAE